MSLRRLDPPDALLFELGGEAPSVPGAYATMVRIATTEGVSLAIPVSVEITASVGWGIGCMLAGLACLGVINFLAGEGEIKARLHDALAARQAIHTVLEASPAPQSRAGDIEVMDRNFDAAVTALGQRHRLSIVDNRVAVAGERLGAASGIADQLRRDLAGRPRGAGEIEDLAQEGAALQAVLQQITALATPAAAPPAPGLAGGLDAFLLRYRTRFLLQPARWISDATASELARVRLAYAAGEGDAVRDLASAARRWLRRSARTLNGALSNYRSALVQAGSMVVADEALRARVTRPDFPGDARASIVAMLDAAAAEMGDDAWLPQWAAAHRRINDAKTASVRAAAEQMKQRLASAIATVNAATDTGDIDRLVETLQAAPDHSVSAKQAGLNQVLDLWRAHIAGVGDAGERDRLRASVDRLVSIVASGDLTATGPIYRALTQDWADWNGSLVKQAANQLDHRQCLDVFADLQQDAGAIEAGLRERLAGPETAAWDRRLDLIRLDMQRQGPDADTVTENCVGPLLDIDQRAIDLSGEILVTTIKDLEVPALTRARLAQALGAAAPAEQGLRTLELRPVTPPDERVAGRSLTFAVDHLDPVWGSGVLVRVDFGDGAPPLIATAEQLRQGRVVAHEYAAPLTQHLTVVATENPIAGVAADPVLGQGTATVLIGPSPVSRAEELAGDFLTLRFGLALLIALIVYHWRYQAKITIFGARSFDYVEAFALGFAANAAALKLPEVLAKFVSS